MLTLPKYVKDGKEVYYGSGVCLSTDTKPIGNVENGTQLIEMDTSTVTRYDAENQRWYNWE